MIYCLLGFCRFWMIQNGFWSLSRVWSTRLTWYCIWCKHWMVLTTWQCPHGWPAWLDMHNQHNYARTKGFILVSKVADWMWQGVMGEREQGRKVTSYTGNKVQRGQGTKGTRYEGDTVLKVSTVAPRPRYQLVGSWLVVSYQFFSKTALTIS